MRVRLLLVVLMAVVLATGCGRAPATNGAGAPARPTPTPASSAPAKRASYSPLAPDGAAEQQAVSLIDKAYAAYAKESVPTSHTPVYRDGDKVKPEFLGYYIRVYSPRQPNGRFATAAVLVLDGTVTTEATWDRAGEADVRTLPRGSFVSEVAEIDDEPMVPGTERQKEAVAKAKAWFAKYLRGQKLERVDLCGLTFAYGKPGDAHWLLLHLQPEKRAYHSYAH